jgi:hypothetical protein
MSTALPSRQVDAINMKSRCAQYGMVGMLTFVVHYNYIWIWQRIKRERNKLDFLFKRYYENKKKEEDEELS